MEDRSKILIVDDNNENIRVLLEILKRDYQLNATTNGFKALEIAKTWDPDLILLDVVMPEIDGFDVCMQLCANEETKDIPVVFVTAISSAEEELSCIRVGGLDYITKPIDPELLKAKIKNYVAIKNDRRVLSKILTTKKSDIDDYVNNLLYLSMSSTEFRDKDVGKWHVKRCVEYVKILIKELMNNVHFSELVSTNLAEAICSSVPYHDIGKSMLPDELILKPDKLTPEEFELMKSHVLLGGDLIDSISGGMEDELFAATVRDVIKYHHERWDGTGYPKGLAGENIPLSARIMTLADQYDTLVSRRIYKKPSFHFEAVRIITSESGKGFDPVMVQAFLNVHEEFLDVVHKYTDTETESDMLLTMVSED